MDDEASIVEWCASHLGSPPLRELFRRSHLSDVVGLELADGRKIVLKIRPRSPRVLAVAAVQRRLHRDGFPCPDVVAGPAALGDRIATAEEHIAPHGPAPDRPRAEPVAELLAALVRMTPSPATAGTLRPAPPWVGWDHAGAQLWPTPDDLDVDMNEHAAPAWIDQTAAAVRERMRRDTAPLVIGHVDWEAQNLDWHDGAPAMVHDWDSLAIHTEAAIAGAAAAVYPSNGSTVVAATIDQTASFLDAYRHATSSDWSADREQIAWCAGLWVLSFNAKKESLGGGTGYLHQLAHELPTRSSRAGL